MYERIRQIVTDSGLWQNGQNYGFVLSPSVYGVTPEKRNELEAIGSALHECMAGLGRIAALAFHRELSHGHTWDMIARVLFTGVPASYREIMTRNPGKVPCICKVDVMEGICGGLFIAEIDGHNKHGLGYSTLAARIRREVRPDATAFPGVASAIAEEVKRRGEESITLICAHKERFYMPEFRILQAELAGLGVELKLVPELGTRINGNGRLFVDLPFLDSNPGLNEDLAALYQEDKIDFLIPPKPFFGSKAVLALLRNDEGDEELEAILRSQIRASSLELVRRHIPTTYLVSKRGKRKYSEKDERHWRGKMNGTNFVLKESISSGMKGTAFPDDPHFDEVMRRACSSRYLFVLQREIANRPRTFEYFAEDGSLREGEWFVRVTVHYSRRRVADIVITARQDKRVHGAPDCLQLGAVIAQA